MKNTLQIWMDDALEMLNKTRGPQIIIGHSVGAWIALQLALKHPDKVAGLLLLGPMYNVFEAIDDLPNGKEDLEETVQTLDGDEDTIEETWQYLIPTAPSSLKIFSKVYIIHWESDEVPYQFSDMLLTSLASKDKHLNILTSANHYLQDLTSLCEIGTTLLSMI
ncbi:uncharacterized protein [Procambarus clarkii]|uniref:uncharacterized protein n=1 Tax=Procambarus clarkii TaxID=6728 RepID=UPI0037434767